MTRGLFVTGTDTGIGKTFVGVGLLHGLRRLGLRAAGMKPVASGSEADAAGNLKNADARALQAASFGDWDYETINPYALSDPIAPHIAAQREGREIEAEPLLAAYRRLAAASDLVVVEGVGGWRVPFSATLQVRDLVTALDLSVLLVVGLRLGCINHALLTAESLIADGVRLSGWVANHAEADYDTVPETLETLAERISLPLLGEVPAGATTADPCWLRLAQSLVDHDVS